jgi:hypothetical protein
VTAELVAVAATLLTAGLLWEEHLWRRRVARQQPMPVVRGRCLCCDGAPVVDDIHTHSRLAHSPRVVGAEDDARWSA